MNGIMKCVFLFDVIGSIFLKRLNMIARSFSFIAYDYVLCVCFVSFCVFLCCVGGCIIYVLCVNCFCVVLCCVDDVCLLMICVINF